MWTREPQMKVWEDLVTRIQARNKEVNIAIVGKYVKLTESYKSLNEALEHAGIANNVKVNRIYVESDKLCEGAELDSHFKDIDGILIPGGFGERGTEGKIIADRLCPEERHPVFSGYAWVCSLP